MLFRSHKYWNCQRKDNLDWETRETLDSRNAYVCHCLSLKRPVANYSRTLAALPTENPPRPRLQNFQGKSRYMKFHKLRVPSLTVTRSVHYYWLAIAREKKKGDPVTSVRPAEDTPFALSDSPFASRCVIFKGMYVSCGRWRRREGTGHEEKAAKQAKPS